MAEYAGDPADKELQSQRTPDEIEEILEEARKRYDDALDRDNKNRKAAKDDYAFVWKKGAQWPTEISDQRNSDWQPCLEANQLQQFVHQVVNDQRQQRPGVRVNSASGDASDEVALILQGMVRHIEYDSQAESAYDSAFEAAVTCGRGYWRVLSQYESGQSFDQKLVIKRVADFLSVVPDADYQEADASDMNFCFVTSRMKKEAFTTAYPSAKELDWQSDDCESWFDGKDEVVVADYYRRVCTKRTLVATSDGAMGWKDEMPKLPSGITIIAERQADEYRVEWFTVAGGQQLLAEHKWPGTIIPVVMCIGDEHMVDGERVFQGLIRPAKDSMMMYNYAISSIAERCALAPKAPWVMAEGQDEGYENMWRDANLKPFSALKYKPVTIAGAPAPPPQRQAPTNVESGLIEIANIAKQDLQSTMGIYDPSLGKRSNEVSGRAILAREKQGDTGTFHYADNLGRAIALTGRIIVEVAADFYDTARIVRIIGTDDEQSMKGINQSMPDPNNPLLAIKQNDLSVGKYAVTVESGPTYATKRQETADMLMKLVQAVPEIMNVAGDLVVKAQDLPDAEQLAERMKFILPPAIQQAEAAKEQDRPPPDPQMLQQLQQSQQQIQQMGQGMQQLQQENAQLKAGSDAKKAAVEADLQVKTQAAQQDAELRDRADQRDTQATIEKAQLDYKIALEKAGLDRQLAIEKAHIEADTKLKVAEIMGNAQIMSKGLEPAQSPVPDATPEESHPMVVLAHSINQLVPHLMAQSGPRRLTYGPDGRIAGSEPVTGPH